MKYDLEVSLGDPNTSHAQVVDLVGTGRRVLDVGCSTGYLARVLRDRGNRVSGVEIDPEAARAAEPVLEQLVVGDLESAELLGRFEAGSFDVVVFADVLEHLRDPVRVLRDAIPLLAPGGSVVVSLPNVAHGAVRLALLEGRFEYRPLGLLDDTHLRFFTRRSVEELLGAAGLRAIDMRRTTADVFATEIPLVPDHFPGELVERVRATPDSDTYQFVFRAVPADGGDPEGLAAELVARNEELAALRAAVGEVHTAAAGYAPQHQVGLLVDDDAGPDRAWSSLRSAVTSLELRRRVDGLALVHLRGDGHSAPATWRGEPVHSLAPGDEATAELIADAYDAVLITAGRSVAVAAPLLDSLIDRDCPVIPAGVDSTDLEKLSGTLRGGAVRGRDDRFTGRSGGLTAVPDPLVLADRLIGGDALPLRLEYLRKTGRLAVEGEYLLAAAGPAGDERMASLGRVLAQMAADADCAVVVIPGPGASDLAPLARAVPGSAVVADPAEVDLLALVHGARAVVTDSAAAACVTVALRRPLLAFGDSEELSDLASWCGDPDLRASTPAELLTRTALAAERAADDTLVEQVRAPIEMAYDELASAVTGAAARRLALSITEILRLQQTRIAALEQANAALQARLVAERNILGARALHLQAQPPADAGFESQRRLRQADEELERARAETAEAHERLAEAERRAGAVQAELDALMATRTMRYLAPSRRLYGRVRHLSQ